MGGHYDTEVDLAVIVVPRKGGLDSLLTRPEDTGSGPFGIVGNLIGDVGEFASGLGALGASAIHDVGRGIAQVVPGSQTWGPINDVDQSGYHLDDIATALVPAIIEDYSTRYGPLLRGDLAEFGEQLYENPLSYGLDVLGAGGVAGGISRRVGSAAVRGSPEALAAANAAAEGLRLARVGGRAATSAGIRTGLDVLATQRPLSGLERLAQRVLPQPTLKAIGADAPSLVPHALSPNPVTRTIQRGLERYTTETLEPLRTQAAETAVQITERAAAGLPESPALAAQFGKLTDTLAQAEAAGLTRVTKPALRELSLWNTTRKTLGELNAHWLQTRSDRLRAVSQTLNPFYKADKTFGERAHGAFMNLDVDLEGVPEGLGPRLYHGTEQVFDEFDIAKAQPGLYGRGIYLTDDPKIAGGYAAGPPKSPNPLEFELNFGGDDIQGQIDRFVQGRVGDPVEVLDVRPATAAERAEALPHSADYQMARVRFARTAAPNVRGAFAKVENPFDVDQPIDAATASRIRQALTPEELAADPTGASEYLSNTPGLTVDEALRRFESTNAEAAARRASAGPDSGMSNLYDVPNDALWKVLSKALGDDGANAVLQRAGYDGIRHIGGRVSGSPAHNVTVAFDPAQVTSALAPPLHGLTESKWAELVPNRKTARLEQTGRERWAADPSASGLMVATARQPDLGAIVGAAEASQPALLQKLDQLAAGVREHLSRITDDELAAKGVTRAQEIDASQRYMEGLYGAVDRATKSHADDVDAAKDAMRWVLADEELGRLRAGDTIEHMMERRYRPLAMKYGRRVNPDTLEFEGGPSWRELDDAMSNAGISQPLYFPFMDPEKLRFSEFLLNRTRIGGVKAARDPHDKLMRGTLLERDTYLKDPMEAYTRRAARLTRAEETYRFIHGTVNALGHRVSSLDEITPGEMVVAPEGLWRTFRNKVAFDDVVDDLTSAGAKVDDTLAEALKAVVFKNQDEIVTAMGQTGKGMELWAVPANVARQMDSYAKFSGAFGSKTLRLFWDKPQDVWRAFVLSGSPRWLVNNAIGNTIFLKLQGGRMADVIRIAEERFKRLLNEKFGTQFSTKMLDQLADIPGMERVGSGFSSAEGMRGVHLGSAADTATGKLYQRLAGAGQTVTRGARAYGGFMTRLNSSIEEVFRQASYLKALERQQILSAVHPVARELWSTKARLDRLGRQSSEITEGQVRAALTEMNNAMGNYGALGPIERNIIRRFFVPFYGYMRHQGTLLARLPFENPIKMQLLSRLGDANEEFMEQYGPLPEWLAGAAPLGPPGPQVSFLASRGAEPFAGSFQDPVSMLSMPLKLALEQAQGRNSFTGEPFTDPDIIRPYGSDQAFRLIRDEAGNVVDAVPVGPARPGILEHVLSQFPQYEMAEQALGGGKAYDTSNLAQIAAGSGTRIDPETGLPLYPTGYGDQASRFLGFPSYEYDLQAYQERLAEQRQAALTQAAG